MTNRITVIKESKELIRKNNFNNLHEILIQKNDQSTSIISALLFVSGFNYVSTNKKNSCITFSAGNSTSDMQVKLTYNTDSKELSGVFRDTIEKTFQVVNALENRFDSLLLYPQEIRQHTIKEFIIGVGIDKTFFETILKNW